MLPTTLRSIHGLMVDDDEAARTAERDFGGLSRGRVVASVRPTTVEALASLVAWARTSGLSLVPRGLGLSQSGQSVAVDGISVDMGGFEGIELDLERRIARCGSAITWRQLLAETAPHGLAPTVSPLNLDLSLGGTLSAGGLGSTSHRYGLAVSAVEDVEVVTGTGEPVRATRADRPDVFHAVLGGLGSFGFITAIGLRLRPMASRVRTFFLRYDDLPTMLADERRLAEEPACTHLEGYASAAVQGTRLDPAGKRVPFARWFYGLQLSVEHAPASAPEVPWLSTLHHREEVHREDADAVEHAARYDPRFAMMKSTGMWQMPHPWLECMMPYDVATALLPEIVPRLPLALGDGHRFVLIADTPRPELLVCPEGPPIVGFCVLPAGVPPGLVAPVLAALHEVHDRLVAAGGKRYLSGWLFEPDEAAWRRHYGDRYEQWQRTKRALDPDGIFRSVLRAPLVPRS